MMTLVELLVQVTAWSMVGVLLMLLVNRYMPAWLARCSMLVLLGIVVLSTLVWIPWPGWINSQLLFSGNSTQAESPALAQNPDTSVTGINLSAVWSNWQRMMQRLPSANSPAEATTMLFDWPFILFGMCLAGMVLSGWRLLLAFGEVRRQVQAASLLEDRALMQLRQSIAQQMHLKCAVKLMESPVLQMAATVGCRQPIILLPTHWKSWTESELRAVLAHELAHIRRADYLVMIMTQLITMIYWFHPLVRCITRGLRSGQELAADALAAQSMGDASEYLRSICRLALHQDDARLPAPARLFLSPEVSFLRRITMLRDGSLRHPPRPFVRWLLLGVLVMTGGLTAALRSTAIASDTPVVKSVSSSWERYASADAPGYVAVYPSAMMSLESTKPLREHLNKRAFYILNALPGVQGMGVPMEAIECMAGPLHVQLRVNNQPGTGSISLSCQYLRFIDAATTETWLKNNTEATEKKECPEGTYYQSTCKADTDNKKVVVNFIRPDERTIVFVRTENDLKAWLKPETPLVNAPWLPLLPKDKGLATLCLNMEHPLVKAGIKQAEDAQLLTSAWKVCYEHEGNVACTIANKDQLILQFNVGCSSEENAKKKKKQLDGIVTIFNGTRDSGATKSNPEIERQQIWSSLLNNMKSSQSGNTLQYILHSNVEFGGGVACELLDWFARTPR